MRKRSRRGSRSREDWSIFRASTRKAKREFFENRIQEIARVNKQPWDLMEWVKQRKLPPSDAIEY